VMSIIDYQEHHWIVKRFDVGDVDDELSKASIYCQKIQKAGVNELKGGGMLGV